MVERNEILVADDEEVIRNAVVTAVREVFPDLTLHEASGTVEALRALHEFGDRIFLVVSDGMMGGDTNAGKDVTYTARDKGVTHVALYSTSAGVLRSRLEPDGIKCIKKSDPTQPPDELKVWLNAISERPQR